MVVSTGYAPTDEFWELWLERNGKAYYVQRERDKTQAAPRKKNEVVKLTPAEAIAWLVNLGGDPAMRRDALKQLNRKGALQR